MTEPVRSYHDHVTTVSAELLDRGSQGIVLLDASPLRVIEDQYGSDVYGEVRRRLFKILSEQRGKDYRNEDVLALDEPRGLRFLFFLDRKRRRTLPTTIADLKAMRTRMLATLAPAMVRAAFPYVKYGPVVEVGYAMAVYNPLMHPERIVRRAIDEALEYAAHARRSDQLSVRERLQDIILRERVVTAYQPIMEMSNRTILGVEALSRGPKGSGLESADVL
ncbi:MAG TPA: hypothetical protein VFM29_09295, partial [Vicinamibacteria bacterium]|nr:hypothetical protein [Vicinamibacteria bacterium]